MHYLGVLTLCFSVLYLYSMYFKNLGFEKVIHQLPLFKSGTMVLKECKGRMGAVLMQ